MSPFLLPLLGVGVVYLGMIIMNERVGLFRCDAFPAPWMKAVAYAWLGVFMLFLAFLVVASSLRQPTAKQIAATPFYQFFALHFILIIFLAGWWLLTGRPRVTEMLNIRFERPGEMVLTGFAVGVGGWLVTIAVALLVAAILKATGLLPKDLKPSPMIGYMVALPIWKKALIVLSAMTVEEAFFRGWLQKRVGLILSTLLFASAHVTLGQPLLLIGVSVISLIIGFTFYRTKNLIPGIVAHGVFDAVQLFVIIPIAFRFAEIGT
jgi:membrane protease YdiL (CAAX protease family)